MTISSANVIAERIVAVEAMIEDTSAALASLELAMTNARRALNVSAPASRRVFARVDAMKSAIGTLRSEIADLHVELDILKKKLEIQTVDSGAWKDDEPVKPTGEIVQLHAA